METLCRHCGKKITWVEFWREWVEFRGNMRLLCAKSHSRLHNPVRTEGAK